MHGHKLKIGILLNCHGQGIAAALRALLPGASVHDFNLLHAMAKPALREHVVALLATCDHIITWRFGPNTGNLSNQALRATGRPVYLMPPFHFRGFHPDTIRVRGPAGNLGGPTGAYHSRLAIAGFLGGLPPAEAAALYNRLVFNRVGYLGVFAHERDFLAERLAMLDLDGVALIDSLTREGCFMHSFEHPKAAPLLELARAVCRQMGVSTAAGVRAADLPDMLEIAPIHPLFPDLAAALGVPPDGMFRGPAAPGATVAPISTGDFVAGSYKVYAAAPRAALLAADGVAQVMDSLGFRDAEESPTSPAAPA